MISIEPSWRQYHLPGVGKSYASQDEEHLHLRLRLRSPDYCAIIYVAPNVFQECTAA